MSDRQAEAVRMRLYYRTLRAITQVLYLLGASGRVSGLGHVPLTGGVLLACNHQSFLDPMLVTLAIPRECHYMARESLFRNRFFGRLISSVNTFPVRSGTSDVAAMRVALRRLAQGALVTVFPESTRTVNGRVSPCQPGVIVLARKAAVPLVPAAIEGAFDAWPRHRKLPRCARILVEYGRPLWPEELASRNRDELAAALTARIRALHNGLRVRAGKQPFEYGD